jgi:hypothetical protein
MTRPLNCGRFKLAYSGRSKISVVGLRGFKLNPALLTYVMSALQLTTSLCRPSPRASGQQAAGS